MLTLHRARGVRRESGGPLDAGHAVVVDGARLAAIGPYEELAAEYGARARVREWDGVLTPGRHEPDGAALLEASYHPDPREADELGSEPLTGEALAGIDMTEIRWGASARRGLQRLLAAGTTSLTGPFSRPAVRTAVRRSGLDELPAPGLGLGSGSGSGSEPGPGQGPGQGPGAGPGPEAEPGPGARALTVGGTATFAVFAGDGSALVTVLAGRLVHRRRNPSSDSLDSLASPDSSDSSPHGK
ncbi:hypothetical protein ACFCVY_12625 [Streptomyces sp. NPDC056411]|uniref:hypothetical protein n=1 Tax=Streptomyces sp. NPDC056411 TaxID=3345813 RepID=UPI0035DBED2C